jgi:tetratricopeptide (TPR) repeat protein
VLVGPNAIGPVQQQELGVALSQARNAGKPVIPVLLPGAGALPLFLGQYSAVYLPDDLHGPAFEQAIDRLVTGITAQPPAPPRPAPPAPKEHVLTIRRHGEVCEGQWDGGNPFEFKLPLTKADLDELAWYLERYIQFPGAGDRARAAALEQRLDDWGRQLWAALFPGGDQHAIHAGICRHLEGGATIPGGHRVLLTLASDSADFLDFCEPPTLPELQRRLSVARDAGRPYHIVHFDGHGQYFPQTGVGALCFEDDQGRTHLVPGRDLGDLLSAQRVPLVLLEACRGAQVSDRPVFGAVAPALLQAGVGSVIAFSHSVHVEAAKLVSERLYQALVAGRSIGAALDAARGALHANPKRWLSTEPDPETIPLQDWLIPQLYQSGVGAGSDPALVPIEQAVDTEAADLPPDETPLPGFPPPPRYRFHGRARELLRLERLLQRHPAVLLHAGGGMGKTALAREAAHWWRRTGRFDLALFHSFETGAGAEAVVQLIGEHLGGEGFGSLPADQQWTEAVRLFRRTRVLLVWDNFESVLPAWGAGPQPRGAGFQPATATDGRQDAGPTTTSDLLPDLQRLYRDLTDADNPKQVRGRLLATCRPTETGLDGIAGLGLAGLARPDALHLLRGVCERREIKLDRPGYDRPAIDALLDRIEDHPLSIELITPHLKDLTPAQIGDELTQRLHQFQDPSHREGRNRSLLASLEFSRGRLSPQAQAALPWLGWFEGGMFERFFLDFSQIPAADWAAIRAELVATALLLVEDVGIQVSNTPYLKLHPTLAEAVTPADPTADGERAGRFIGVYRQVRDMIQNALIGSDPAAGIAIARLEQTNLRRAMDLAFAAGRRRDGAMLADTLGAYLQMAGRLREHDRLVQWVLSRMPADRLDATGCAAIHYHAWGLFTQGKAQAALDAVLDLERRLAGGKPTAVERLDEDPAIQLALARLVRGRILDRAGRADLALEPLRQAIADMRALTYDAADPNASAFIRGNLSAALGDLANALSALGRTDAALAAANEAAELDPALGNDCNLAIRLGQTAAILMDAGRHAEAEAGFGEALVAAVRIGDLELQGTLTQRLGNLQRETDRPAEAVETLKLALRLFQQAGNRRGEMQTCDLLGSAEQHLGRLDPAEAWYRKALDLAGPLGDQCQIAGTRQNLGILFQTRAEQAPDPIQHADPHPNGPPPAADQAGTGRDRWLAAAVTEIEASLAIWQQMNNQINAASSHGQLAVLHRLRGDLDRAEAEARQALAIHEPLDHPDTWKDYLSLAQVARARGESTAADQWQAKADAKHAEMQRRARGGSEDAADAADPAAAALQNRQFLDALVALAQAVYQHQAAAAAQPPAPVQPLPPDIAETLAQLTQLPPPLPTFAAFLQAIAASQRPTPAPLPALLDQLAADLLQALR